MNKQTRNFALDARLFGALVAFMLGERMFTGGLWVMTPESVTGRIASLSTYPIVVACIWMTLSLCVLPYLICQIFNCWQAQRKKLTRYACWATMAGGTIWAYLGYLSKNLDYSYVTGIFLTNTLSCFAMAAVLANGLNTEQRRAEDAAP